jgi:hypothetical protein
VITPRAALGRLEALRLEFSPAASRAKREAVGVLARSRLTGSGEILRAHEALCFLRAYPDDAPVLAAAERALQRFGRRADLRARSEELADSGIAGTPIRYRFFWPMARWLAARYGNRLSIDWTDGEFAGRLAAALPVLVTQAEGEAILKAGSDARTAIDRVRPPRTTDACFLIARIEALPGGDRVRESFHDAIDVAYRLAPGASGPSRTSGVLEIAPASFRAETLERGRPDLRRALARSPRAVRPLSEREGARAIDLAREAMVTRSRDLDAFAHGNARDVRLVDDGDGLSFALIGLVSERRLFLPAVYGALTVRNRVPIGYVQIDVLFGNAEISYNTFTTFRGAEAGFVFGRLLAATRHVFGVSSFSVEPYQLGRGNEEGIASGAWWFYAHAGFRPRDPAILRLARAELARQARHPGYRSGRRTLERLACAHVHWDADPRSTGTVTPIDGVGRAIAHHLASLGGSNRDAAVDACEERAARRLGIRSTRAWTRDERLWWRRWAPMLDAIPNLERWTASHRAALVRVARAKGGRRESDFAALFAAHPKIAPAILAIARR